MEERLCNRLKGCSRCIQKINLDKCPAIGKTPEEKKRNCVAGKMRRYEKG